MRGGPVQTPTYDDRDEDDVRVIHSPCDAPPILNLNGCVVGLTGSLELARSVVEIEENRMETIAMLILRTQGGQAGLYAPIRLPELELVIRQMKSMRDDMRAEQATGGAGVQ